MTTGRTSITRAISKFIDTNGIPLPRRLGGPRRVSSAMTEYIDMRLIQQVNISVMSRKRMADRQDLDVGMAEEEEIRWQQMSIALSEVPKHR
jgi:hypothetical protein